MDNLISILIDSSIKQFKDDYLHCCKLFLDDSKKNGLTHAGEFGMYREKILSQFLQRFLPENMSINNGFVINCEGGYSTQTDIIIYDKDYTHKLENVGSNFFPAETIYAIGEVKSELDKPELKKALEKLKKTKEMRVISPEYFEPIRPTKLKDDMDSALKDLMEAGRIELTQYDEKIKELSVQLKTYKDKMDSTYKEVVDLSEKIVKTKEDLHNGEYNFNAEYIYDENGDCYRNPNDAEHAEGYINDLEARIIKELYGFEPDDYGIYNIKNTDGFHDFQSKYYLKSYLNPQIFEEINFMSFLVCEKLKFIDNNKYNYENMAIKTVRKIIGSINKSNNYSNFNIILSISDGLFFYNKESNCSFLNYPFPVSRGIDLEISFLPADEQNSHIRLFLSLIIEYIKRIAIYHFDFSQYFKS